MFFPQVATKQIMSNKKPGIANAIPGNSFAAHPMPELLEANDER
jgi:hypothetical protein